MRAVLVIGAQRSATTFLYRGLDGHPGITMARPERPEPKYFLRPVSEDATATDWVTACFPAGAPDGVVLGEKSTSYIESHEVPVRVARALPDAVVVASLRDPVERALSNYRFSVANGIETRDPWTALVSDAEPSWDRSSFSVSPFDYTGRSDYLTGLEAWWASGFEVHVVIAEALVDDPRVLGGIHEAVGLEARPEAMPDSAVNTTEVCAGIPAAVVSTLRVRLRPRAAALADRLGQDLDRWWPTLE